MSVSFISVKSECNICKKEFSECEHIRGEPYIGKSCTEICTEMKDFHHADLVNDPDDKRCRTTHYGDSNPHN